MNLVWLKRDLRVSDHEALATACLTGETIALYVYEPEIIDQPDFDAIHLQFINESLIELSERLSKLGGKLIIGKGSVIDVFEQLHAKRKITYLWSHREVGNEMTFSRDIKVQKWAANMGIPWTEFSQNGVIRKLKCRDGWSARWALKMRSEVIEAPEKIESPCLDFNTSPMNAQQLGISERSLSVAQKGGETEAWEILNSFLSSRGRQYRKQMSSPLTAFDACSRISPYISWGCISVRQVYQEAVIVSNDVKAGLKSGAGWGPSLKSFISRLSWHCHFMQKLEDQPNMDWVNISRAHDGLRADSWYEEYFQAWKEGKTGFPIVDACMRAVKATGYLNFRMRAMVVSFASYHLWLHWRKTGEVLARYFLDYEPGIHWSQIQMQSGTTGINTIRVYSPIKQSEDQDPEGVFIKRWVPELANVPDPYVHQPHLMPEMEQMFCCCEIGKDYPLPVVDHKTAYRRAQDIMYATRKTETARSEVSEILEKHGRRKRRGS